MKSKGDWNGGAEGGVGGLVKGKDGLTNSDKGKAREKKIELKGKEWRKRVVKSNIGYRKWNGRKEGG